MRLGTILGSKILKKGVQIGPKLKHGLGTQEGHLALLECRSAHGKCRSTLPKFRLAQTFARLGDLLIKIEPIFFDFLEIRTHSNSYLILVNIPTSINRGNKSELKALFFGIFNSPYVKDVLEAFVLGISFL